MECEQVLNEMLVTTVSLSMCLLALRGNYKETEVFAYGFVK